MIGWVIGIVGLVILCAFLFVLVWGLCRYFKWIWRNIKAGTNPFQGVSPMQAFFVWRFTRPGSEGDLFRHR